MKQFITFTKKEISESAATYRLYILVTVLIFLGVMGPLMALLTPTILESLAGSDTGIIIILPEPSAVDAWIQFFNGFVQINLPVLTVIFCGVMSNEFSKGTLINLLTKGLKRHTVVLSKFLSSGILWTVACILSIGICYIYTAFYWETDPINQALLVFGAPWLFGLLIIALLIFGGTLFGNFYGSLLTCGGVIIILNFISLVLEVPLLNYNPITLARETVSVIQGVNYAYRFIPAMITGSILIAVLLIGAVVVFNRKKV